MRNDLKPLKPAASVNIVATVRHMVRYSPEIKLALEAELAMPAEDATEADLRTLLSPSAIEGIHQYAALLEHRKSAQSKREKRRYHGGRP